MNEHAYLLGLFEGDGYQWTGTFGITNRNKEILQRAAETLTRFGTVKWKTDERGFFRVLITSRVAKRNFLSLMKDTKKKVMTGNLLFLAPYFAGKYDADGSYWKTRMRLKITYGNNKDIKSDQEILMSIGIESKIRKYKNRNAFDLEISSRNAIKFFDMIKTTSIRSPFKTT